MREHAVVDVFARSHELERSLEALKAELSTSEKGPDLIASLERLHQRGHPAAKPGADPRRLAAAAAELVSDNDLPAWRAPDQYKAPARESPERRSSRASELMQRLETKYAVPHTEGAVSVAPPPDVVRARSATTAPERRAMPIQRFVPPASPSKAPSPAPPPASVRAGDSEEPARRGAAR